LIGLFPLVFSTYEVYNRTTDSLEFRFLITAALAIIWIFGFYFYSWKEKDFREQIYWPIWSNLIFATSLMQPVLGIYWISMSAGILYLIFQSQNDKSSTKNWMLLSFGVDLIYLVLSPEILSPENRLLVSPENVPFLDTLLRTLVPLSLSLKIIGLHKSLIDRRRNEFICSAELFFFTALLLYKFSFGFTLEISDWYIISVFFMCVLGIVLLKAILYWPISFHSVLSLFLLNASVYICQISFFEFSFIQLLAPMGILFMQRVLFRYERLSPYSPLLTIFSLFVFMILGSSVHDSNFLISLFLMIVGYLMWIYNENIYFRRANAS
jgi:hypothetical protein